MDSVQQSIQAMKNGQMVILVDDEDRENEGDLVCAADKVTPELINFMAKYGRGLICLPMTDERLRHLDIPMMVGDNTSPFETAFTVSIEARTGVTTGISAADRARTIQVAVDPEATAADLSRPGHIFPLRARDGGVLVRTGQTEGSVDLARLAGCYPAAVICEIMNEDGTMARMPDLEKFAAEHDIPILTIADLVHYRLTRETLINRIVDRVVKHPIWGEVTLISYGTDLDDRQHLAVIKGDIASAEAPLVRVHSGYPLSNVFGDLFTSDRAYLNAALEAIGAEECGVLVCIDRGTPFVPLDERIRDLGNERVENAEPTPAPVTGTASGVLREFGIGAQILRELGLHKIRLISNNPRRLAALEGFGLSLEDVVPLVPKNRIETTKQED